MVIVLSQTRTKPTEEAVQAYIDITSELLPFMQTHPGFLGRALLRSKEDPWHFAHYRMFDSVESYEEMTKLPGYFDYINRMEAHMDGGLHREYYDVIIDDTK